jgi:hypothetical protein
MRVFTPSHLRNQQPIESFSLVSDGYWKFAEQIVINPNGSTGNSHTPAAIFTSIWLYLAAFEAFIQETIAYARSTAVGTKLSTESTAKFEALASARRPYNEFKPWVREAYRAFDKSGVGIDTDSTIYQNLVALKELRNATIHYNANMIRRDHWPLAVQEAFRRAAPPQFRSSWVGGLSRPEVSSWARDTARIALEEFWSLAKPTHPFRHDETETAFWRKKPAA